MREYPQASASSSGGEAKRGTKGILQMIQEATDLFAFAKSILPQAKAGDAAAQYALWKAHSICYESGTGAFAHDNGQALSWGDAVQRAASMRVPIEKAQWGYDLCHRFFSDDTSDLGDAMTWLQRATEQGYPNAQVATAKLRIQQESLKAFERAGGVPTGYGLLPPIGGDAQPSDLLLAAVQSLDPQVIQEVGMMANTFGLNAPLDQRKVNIAAWIYVSCLRGADCSSYGDPDKSYCSPSDSNCVGVPAKLLELNQYNWDPVKDRANEINAALDAKDWGKLGLGS
jgi:TPR repeat protein